MFVEQLLLTIEGSMAIGAIAGLGVGIFVARPKVGCLLLSVVPVAMIFFIAWWQAEHPDKLRSTSGLEFIFGSLWPSLGAIGGYAIGQIIRSVWHDR